MADAEALPFPDGVFGRVVSSGMIEHIGVEESSSPYTVAALPDRDARRCRVVLEMARVAGDDAAVVIDCPNGGFPVDFWHGDRVGAFRLHPVPDELLPTYGELRRWAAEAGRTARLRPLAGRLAFRQVGMRWWGRLLAPPVKIVIAVLDLLVRVGLDRPVSRFYPYLVVELWKTRLTATRS